MEKGFSNLDWIQVTSNQDECWVSMLGIWTLWILLITGISFLFICGLYNDALSSSDCIASDD
jgi:hypothetical protein